MCYCLSHIDPLSLSTEHPRRSHSSSNAQLLSYFSYSFAAQHRLKFTQRNVNKRSAAGPSPIPLTHQLVYQTRSKHQIIFQVIQLRQEFCSHPYPSISTPDSSMPQVARSIHPESLFLAQFNHLRTLAAPTCRTSSVMMSTY